MEKKTTIELTKKEIELFKKFKEYRDLWEKIFEIRGGQAVLHFDNRGNLMEAHSNRVRLFKRKKWKK